VSYFSGTKPVEGNTTLAVTHNGVRYRFASAKNRDAFMANPERYEPQYGGWCAYAMGSSGEKVEVDPLTFKIVDGKLYLFYNAYFNNTLKKWNENEASLKRQADLYWAKITKP
jgi:YHS domain-containing protein